MPSVGLYLPGTLGEIGAANIRPSCGRTVTNQPGSSWAADKDNLAMHQKPTPIIDAVSNELSRKSRRPPPLCLDADGPSGLSMLGKIEACRVLPACSPAVGMTHLSPAFTLSNRLIGRKVYPESIPEPVRGSHLFVFRLPTHPCVVLSHAIVPSGARQLGNKSRVNEQVGWAVRGLP